MASAPANFASIEFSAVQIAMLQASLKTHVGTLERAQTKAGDDDELRGYYARKVEEFRVLSNHIGSKGLFK